MCCLLHFLPLFSLWNYLVVGLSFSPIYLISTALFCIEKITWFIIKLSSFVVWSNRFNGFRIKCFIVKGSIIVLSGFTLKFIPCKLQMKWMQEQLKKLSDSNKFSKLIWSSLLPAILSILLRMNLQFQTLKIKKCSMNLPSVSDPYSFKDC